MLLGAHATCKRGYMWVIREKRMGVEEDARWC